MIFPTTGPGSKTRLIFHKRQAFVLIHLMSLRAGWSHGSAGASAASAASAAFALTRDDATGADSADSATP